MEGWVVAVNQPGGPHSGPYSRPGAALDFRRDNTGVI